MIEDKRISYYKKLIKELKEENTDILADNEKLRIYNERLKREISDKNEKNSILKETLEKAKEEYINNINDIKNVKSKYNDLIISIKEEKLKYRTEFEKLILALK